MKDVMGALGLGVRFRRCRFLSIMIIRKKSERRGRKSKLL